MKNKILSGIMGALMAYMPMQTDAAEIRAVPYRQFQRVEPSGLKPSSELETILKEDDMQPRLALTHQVQDKEKFKEYFLHTSKSLGYDLEKVSNADMKGFLSWQGNVVKYIMQPYFGKTDADEMPPEEIMSKRYGGKDSVKGVCRHYATMMRDAFYIMKDMNKNVKDLECIVTVNKKQTHGWNMYLMQGDSKIISTELDIYAQDMREGMNAWKLFGSDPSPTYLTGSYVPNVTDSLAPSRWSRNKIWEKHTKENITKPYTKEKWNK